MNESENSLPSEISILLSLDDLVFLIALLAEFARVEKKEKGYPERALPLLTAILASFPSKDFKKALFSLPPIKDLLADL